MTMHANSSDSVSLGRKMVEQSCQQANQTFCATGCAPRTTGGLSRSRVPSNEELLAQRSFTETKLHSDDSSA